MVTLPKIHLFAFLLIFQLTGSQAWFQQLFNLGGRTSNCRTWGLWSKCFSTEKARFRQFFDVPAECSYSAYGNYLTTTAGPLLEQVYEYFQLINMSAHACGQCSFQISCSRNCYVPTLESDVSFTGNRYGITSRLCQFDQTSPCVVNPSEAYNPQTGVCQVWPPLRRGDIFPNTVPQDLKQMLYSMQTTNCISVSGKCYCCCAPYKPDPCTAKCTLYPCSPNLVFDANNLPVAGQPQPQPQLQPQVLAPTGRRRRTAVVT